MAVDIAPIPQVDFDLQGLRTGFAGQDAATVDLSGYAGVAGITYACAANGQGRVVPWPAAIAGLISGGAPRLAELVCALDSPQDVGTLEVLMARHPVDPASWCNTSEHPPRTLNRAVGLLVLTHPVPSIARRAAQRLLKRIDSLMPNWVAGFEELAAVDGAYSCGVHVALFDWRHVDQLRLLAAAIPVLDPAIRRHMTIEPGEEEEAQASRPKRIVEMMLGSGGGMERHVASSRALHYTDACGDVIDIAWPGAGVLVGVQQKPERLVECQAVRAARGALSRALMSRFDVLKPCSPAAASVAIERLVRSGESISSVWVEASERVAWVRATWNGRRTRQQLAAFAAAHLGECPPSSSWMTHPNTA